MSKVSVVITTCKREPLMVKEAIDSVIHQTYPDFEIIVVNDAPKYEKRKELEDLILKYGNSVTAYIINENQMGANYSRNLGVHNSTGDIISFLDDDDYWHPERLVKVVNAFEKGADIVYSDYYIFTDRRTKYSKQQFPKPEDQLRVLLASNYLGGFSNVAISSRLFKECGELDERMPSYQDQDLFIRLLQKGKLGYLNEALSYYRINSNSISLNGEKKYRGMMMLFDKYNTLFKDFPDSKRIRLESELIYARKQGWAENAKRISNMLKEYDSNLRIIKLSLNGRLKYVAVKIFKLQ